MASFYILNNITSPITSQDITSLIIKPYLGGSESDIGIFDWGGSGTWDGAGGQYRARGGVWNRKHGAYSQPCTASSCGYPAALLAAALGGRGRWLAGTWLRHGGWCTEGGY